MITRNFLRHTILLRLLFVASFELVYFQSIGQHILETQKWIHGADCGQNKDVPIEILKYSETTYILRQNKCLHYEAPFMYLFIGRDKALLVDTGAETPASSFPLYELVTKILTNTAGPVTSLVVIHSHGHSDHYAGDDQFKNKHGVQLIPPTKNDVVNFFKLKDWPESQAAFDLGGRVLDIIPIPGHDEMSIAIYDPQTRWLLTGDTIYPGRLYVRDGKAFCLSISRLATFAKTHPVEFLMGNHIEMSRTKGVDYPVGTIYQPGEHALPLRPDVLQELVKACGKMGDRITYEVHDDFIIVPK